MPKHDRHDQAEIWSADQFEQVMGELSPTMRRSFRSATTPAARSARFIRTDKQG